ncbi:MAG: glycosyltransferase family 39 protein [Candidatus Giovannonibacteria bacterium]|nr:MAG: glycosyltransferase family 39 protein [Candidatus Giovannonibacteria bacterium]
MRKYWLIAILILAAVLRIYGLERGDTVNDEVFYAFRAIGLMDFDKAPDQTTPLEWFDPHTKPFGVGVDSHIPWWTKISFHDHPPLVFWVQHFFMNIFGDSAWAFRLPSAVFGVASVYLVYLIGAILFSETAGLLASAFFAMTLNGVYISRTGMQEPYVIFFMLLASYFFLKAVGKPNSNYLIWTGIALGLGFLAKYNVFIMAPFFLAYLAVYKRDYFLNKKLWLGTLIVFVIFSPVIIYNIELYRAVGHFDFQLSYVFGQSHPEWQSQPGKEIGTAGERVKNFVPRLIATNSWLFLVIFAGSLIFLRNSFLFFVFGFLLLLFSLIGPAYRFLTMLTPWMALSVGSAAEHYFFAFLASLGVAQRQTRSKTMLGSAKIAIFALIAVFAFEIFYSYNNQIAYYPKGPQPWLSSKVRYENYNWGYNELNDYLEKELAGKMPAFTFTPKYLFLNELQDKALADALAKNLEPYPALIVYYGNFDDGPRLWIFDRLNFYRAWPVISFDTYLRFIEENGFDYYKKSGFRAYYFIEAANIVPSKEFRSAVAGQNFISVKNPRGEEAFKIYRFDML